MTPSARGNESTAAFLLGSVPHRESDLIVQLFTPDGRVGAVARGARRSQKRFGGALSPFHTLSVSLEPGRGELMTLREASLETVRLTLTQNLEAMEGAGRALRWLRRGVPQREPHPRVFLAMHELLDALDAPNVHDEREDASGIEAQIARFGLLLLRDLGYALTLAACAVCGRPRPPSLPAYFDTSRGGVVCTSCGGGGERIPAPRLAAWQAWEANEPNARLTKHDARALEARIEEVLLAHVDT